MISVIVAKFDDAIFPMKIQDTRDSTVTMCNCANR